MLTVLAALMPGKLCPASRLLGRSRSGGSRSRSRSWSSATACLGRSVAHGAAVVHRDHAIGEIEIAAHVRHRLLVDHDVEAFLRGHAPDQAHRFLKDGL